MPSLDQSQNNQAISVPLSELDENKTPYWLALNAGQQGRLYQVTPPTPPTKKTSLVEILDDLYAFQMRDLDYTFYFTIQNFDLESNEAALKVLKNQYQTLVSLYRERHEKLKNAVLSGENSIPKIGARIAAVSDPHGVFYPIINHHEDTLEAWINEYNHRKSINVNNNSSDGMGIPDFIFLNIYLPPYYNSSNGLYCITPLNGYFFNASAEFLTKLISNLASFTKEAGEALIKNLGAASLLNPFSNFHKGVHVFSALKYIPNIFSGLKDGMVHIANAGSLLGTYGSAVASVAKENALAGIAIALGIPLTIAAAVSLTYSVKKIINSVVNLCRGDKPIRSAIRILASLGGGAGGALGGMLLGAMVGSIVPGVGTALGALIGLAFGGVFGLNGGALASKYGSKLASYLYYKNDETIINPTNPDKYRLTAEQENSFTPYYRQNIYQMLAEIHSEKSQLGTSASVPFTDARECKNAYNQLIKDVKEGKMGSADLPADVFSYIPIIASYVENYKSGKTYTQEDLNQILSLQPQP